MLRYAPTELHMRPVTWSILAGANAIVAVSVADYLLTPGGDTHFGSSIYAVLAGAYLVCLLLGTAVAKLSATLMQELGPTRVLLFLSFMGILLSNTGAFLLIYWGALGYWPWELGIMGLVAPLLVGLAAASAFVYAYKLRTN